jgi:signal transduction histidine kinase
LCCDFNEQAVDVSFVAKGKLPFWGRPIAIKRALNNLIKNGVEYGNKVDVFVVNNKEEIEIHIKDEGPGIKNEDKERLFEPFERTEESRNRNSGGIGLGMAIARSVVRAHGGEIELNNRSAKGLDVVVILPF